MGCDIHIIGEYKDYCTKEWEIFMIPESFKLRNYGFFAWLGNVRNGSGFKPINPITDNRGMPEDVSRIGEDWYYGKLSENMDDILGFCGNHSYGYIYLSELKKAKVPIVEKYGVIPVEKYKQWDKKTSPFPYSLGVSGYNVITINHDEVDHIILKKNKEYYVNCKWEEKLFNEEFIKDLIKYLEFWKDHHKSFDNEVRLLFTFDN
jgi:hypothetical protein